MLREAIRETFEFLTLGEARYFDQEFLPNREDWDKIKSKVLSPEQRRRSFLNRYLIYSVGAIAGLAALDILTKNAISRKATSMAAKIRSRS